MRFFVSMLVAKYINPRTRTKSLCIWIKIIELSQSVLSSINVWHPTAPLRQTVCSIPNAFISTLTQQQRNAFWHTHTHRNPTQVVNAAATNGVHTSANCTSRSSCPCARSKSMEDVRTEVVSSSGGGTATTDWPTYIKDNFKNLNNGREMPQSASTAVSTMMSTATKHSNTRRSMDNLLKVDTNYGRPFQVGKRERERGLKQVIIWLFEYLNW